MQTLVFPDAFMWGASTSAHQIEGGNTNNDWWVWEQSGRAPESGQACGSWSLWRQDIDTAAQLGLDIFRISAEWSRIEPEPGRFDEDAIAHYLEVLRTARERGLKTMLVLWHFTNPAWLAERHGWQRREAAEKFGEYARLMAQRLGQYVDFWATLNEANTFAWRGYVKGMWPPGHEGDWLGAYRALRGLAEGHRHARRAIKAVDAGAYVGLTHVLVWPHAASRGGRPSGPMRAWWTFLANDLFLDSVARECDWLGVQYYHDSPTRLISIADDDGSCPRTDMGWRIMPQGLYEVVMRTWKRYQLPILVTENGLADANDRQRSIFILDHLSWLHKAVAEGADVRGYLHWSLLDNFEWECGFGPRFGLVEVDYETMARSIRPSGRLFAQIAQGNSIEPEMFEGLTYADGSGSQAPNG